MLRVALRRLSLVLGHLWTAPNTLLGVIAGLAGMPFGARPELLGCALAFRRMPHFRGALVLGGVILHDGATLDVTVPTYATRGQPESERVPVSLAAHELAHVYQYLVLGPLFLPIYALCGGVSARNPFERAADRYAASGASWWPWS